MVETQELHGRLPDGQPCELKLLPNRFVVTIPSYGVPPHAVLSQYEITDPLVIALANGKTATLQNVYYAGHTGHLGPESFVLRRIGANRVIVEQRAFGSEDFINSIRFRPTNELIAEYYLRHRGHVRLSRLGNIGIQELFEGGKHYGEIVVNAVDTDRTNICRISYDDGVSISLRVIVSEAFTPQGGRIEEGRWTYIEYEDPVGIETALQDVMCMCNFYSFIVGEVVIPKEIGITSGDVNEGRRPTFEIHTALRNAGTELDPKDAYRCLMSAQFDGTSYEHSLKI